MQKLYGLPCPNYNYLNFVYFSIRWSLLSDETRFKCLILMSFDMTPTKGGTRTFSHQETLARLE